ncbi:MAG: hypothetical protein HOE90_01435 [Bacteriovoracaceae bacterium]|mgnify:CR=1 FL=1|jgi:Na+-translocating ferredoxin:NAD+ oxidoreductase RnfD subunit|nr:hypothetical protein [Bacteriovoracaceae bacterium]
MLKLITNILLFPVTIFPVVALVGFIQEGVFGDLSSTEPGFNPILWLIYTAPWVSPAVILSPIIHIVVQSISKRSFLTVARLSAVILSPLLFSLAMLVLWGVRNFTVDSIFPIVIAGFVYGGIFRIHDK